MNYFEDVIKDYFDNLKKIEQNLEFIIYQKELHNTIKPYDKLSKFVKPLENVINSSMQYNSIIVSLYPELFTTL